MELSTVLRALLEHQDYRRGYVSDYASEYGEPGYSSEGPILLGNYWCHCANGPDAAEENTRAAERGSEPHYLHGMECHHPRVFALLEEEGCALEWEDEWVIVNDRAYRTSPDSYSWAPTAVYDSDSGEFLVPEDGISAWLEWAINNPTRAFMPRMFSNEEMNAEGFEERDCSLESGWHGVEDDPRAILESLQEERDCDVVFMISSNEQFRTKFCVYTRDLPTLEDEESEGLPLLEERAQ